MGWKRVALIRHSTRKAFDDRFPACCGATAHGGGREVGKCREVLPSHTLCFLVSLFFCCCSVSVMRSKLPDTSRLPARCYVRRTVMTLALVAGSCRTSSWKPPICAPLT